MSALCERPVTADGVVYPTYSDYLASAVWNSRRRVALERAGYRCQLCNSGARLQVHHRTYERIGREQPSDLTVLCRGCHQRFHGVTTPDQPQKKRAAKKPEQKAQWKVSQTERVIGLLGSFVPEEPFTVAEFVTRLRAMEEPIVLSRSGAGQLLRSLAFRGLVRKRSKRIYEVPLRKGSHAEAMRAMKERNAHRVTEGAA